MSAAGLPEGARRPEAAGILPLEGITVVTLEHAIAGPFCTRQLADLGARVIKIERPGSGDFARGYDERVRGLASHFVWTNRSKESLTLDVKHREAPEILGQAPAMQEVFRAIGRLSQSSATVLITGESGTGKELVARALHRHSPRAAGPFVAINTAAIPKEIGRAHV